MATTDSRDYTVTARDVIYRALRWIGAFDSSETPSAADVDDALDALNQLLMAWRGEGIGLHNNQFATLFLQPSTNQYALGATGANATKSYSETTVGTAASSGDTSITVASAPPWTVLPDIDAVCTTQAPAAGGAQNLSIDGVLAEYSVVTLISASYVTITSPFDLSARTFTVVGTDADGDSQSETVTGPNNETVATTNKYLTITTIQVDDDTGNQVSVGIGAQYLGIELDDGTLQWTEATRILLTTSTLIHFANALTDDAAVGNKVYAYTDKISRPIAVTDVNLKYSSGTESSLEIVLREDWMNIATKSTTGKPVQCYYDPQIPNGQLYVWPTPSTVDDIVELSFQEAVEDLDTADDYLDVPRQWIRAITFNLGLELAGEYDIEPSRMKVTQAREAKTSMLSSDQPRRMIIVPRRRYRRQRR